MKLKHDTGIIKKLTKIYNEYSAWYLNPTSKNLNNSRQVWQTVVHKFQHGPTVVRLVHIILV